MEPRQDDHYRKLDTLDAKCGALLQLSSVMVVFLELRKADNDSAAGRVTTLLFLVAAVLALFVLWFKERPDSAFVAHRCSVFNAAVVITAIGCAATFATLVPGLLSAGS
jgi:hypothetical protein